MKSGNRREGPAAGAVSASGAYRLRAWLAVATLALFLLVYFGLAAWFALTAWRLTFGSAGRALWGWLAGACAAFLAVFMLKAVLFVKHGGGEHRVEITPAQQPELFRFLHQLAHQAGAPQPHKVFVSPQVNAAVFYDLSVLNLFLPSKKNLEIGLGLVNALTLGEFRAVLAHEFGHFAQRAMAVGRWVYVAQQIAAHLIARRDKLDDFLIGLSNTDVRIAWVGWILRLIVWSIRSLVDSVFRLVLIVQRALSRQMELNADLVAVSLTGSDALIHALYKLESADDAWNRAVGFVLGEKARGRLAPDLFAIQSQVVARVGQLLGDPHYGRAPVAPAAAVHEPAQHRVFKAALAQPPQMWLSHPLNHDREENAKRHYIAAPIDERPAWVLFNEPQALREAVTAQLLGQAPADAKPHDDPLGTLGRQYEREYFDGRYRGVYFGRSIARHAGHLHQLVDELPAPSADQLAALYPASLAGDMESLRALQKERAQLEGLKAGHVQAPGGVIQHRGRVLQRRELGGALAEVQAELDTVVQRLQAHDRQCRSLHRAAARGLGQGWPEYLQGLLAAVHFADHAEDNLRDLQGLLSNTVRVATATRKVSRKGIQRVLLDANTLRDAMVRVFDDAPSMKLDETLLQRLQTPSWAVFLGELKLPPAAEANIGEWLGAAAGWVDHTAGACAALRTQALEQLLLSEARVAEHLRLGTPAGAAPAATVVPLHYAKLLPGEERRRQTQLDWWGRFQTADGWLPATARIAAAGGIVAAVLGLGGSVGSASITVYNGLARSVVVQMGRQARVTVPPATAVTRDVDADQTLRIETRATEGALIETFDAEVRGSFGHFVYNVAGAAPLVEWTAAYGGRTAPAERRLGAPRWSSTGADVLFSEPPKSISSKTGGGTRLVLTGLGDGVPSYQLDMLPPFIDKAPLAAAHARWDALSAPNLMQWMWVAKEAPGFPALLQARLAETPDEVLLLRMQQDSADPAGRAALCERHQARAAAAPQDPGPQYLATRCLPEGPQKDQAFVDGHARHPAHGWFAYAAAYVAAGQARWPQAITATEVARREIPALRHELAVDLARMRRLQNQASEVELAELGNASSALSQLLALESGQGIDSPSAKAYSELARGRIDSAVQMAHSKPQTEARLLRLAAASDRASPALVAQALALPPEQGVDGSTVWASVGLAARAGRDLSAFEPAMQRAAAFHAVPMRRFVDALRSGQPVAQVEALLEGLPPELRGQAYSLGTIVLGARAPAAWREGAKRLLFAPERPYFS